MDGSIGAAGEAAGAVASAVPGVVAGAVAGVDEDVSAGGGGGGVRGLTCCAPQRQYDREQQDGEDDWLQISHILRGRMRVKVIFPDSGMGSQRE